MTEPGPSAADARARATEAQMTDDERFALLVTRSANDIVLSAEAALTERRFGR